MQDQITCKGLNRALGLLSVIDTHFSGYKMFFIPEPGSSAPPAYIKPLMTLEPAVIAHRQTFWTISNESIFKHSILENPQFAHGNIIIAWPKNRILGFVRQVYSSYGGDPNVIPNEVDQNAIYQIGIDGSGRKPASFKLISQGLDNISEICPKNS